MDHKIKTFEDIGQPTKGLVIDSWPSLLLITNSIQNELRFSETTFFQNIPFRVEFIYYISGYLLESANMC